MNYVCTGLCGRLKRLKKIEQMTLHNDDDRLYIIGDVLSIGRNPFEMVSYVKEHPQMILLKSATMRLALLEIQRKKTTPDKRSWLIFLNGVNIRASLNKCENRQSMIDYMKGLNDFEYVDIGNTQWMITGYQIRKSDTHVICRTYEKKEKIVNGNIIGLNPIMAYAICLENGHTCKYLDHMWSVSYNKYSEYRLL